MGSLAIEIIYLAYSGYHILMIEKGSGDHRKFILVFLWEREAVKQFLP